jgi:peptidoglycan/xylan/chitin deacetylase (PgdA/CDA1 family)
MSRLYWHKTPPIFSKLFPSFLWHKSREEKTIFLTFDDGPIPEVTDFILSELEEYGAKATFFCVGHNIEKYPDTFQRTIHFGHSIGNHTHNHLNARKVSPAEFVDNISLCQSEINKHGYFRIHKLFRPPYGMLRKRNTSRIRENYQIVMWDVLSGDFDSRLGQEKCLSNTIRSTENGSIIVFHDNEKSGRKIKYVLPRFLSYFAEREYKFKAI